MDVQYTILQQLGGNKFVAMTGSSQFVATDENTLSMKLVRNMSGANKLFITLDPDYTYTMRFVKYSAPRCIVNHRSHTCTLSQEKTKEIETFHCVYCDMLQDIFTQVTGLDTHL